MLLGATEHGIPLHHDVHESFGELLRGALVDQHLAVGLGPLYRVDPAIDVLRPFMRSMIESRYTGLTESQLVPDDVLDRIRKMRLDASSLTSVPRDEMTEWVRAGLVLEIANLRGVHLGSRVIHVPWTLNATVTGRFGAGTVRGPGWAFNPLSLSEEQRTRVRPSDHTRMIAVFDFKAVDVCSMASLVPSLNRDLAGHPDPYTRVAELTGLDRDEAKLNLLTWAYDGFVSPKIRSTLERELPGLHETIQGLPHGEFPRMVQSVSAIAFRAALSRVLPMLTGIDLIPMFTVHDEIVLDVSERAGDRLREVTMALELGASERIGRPYRVGIRTGYTYEEAKNG